MGSRVDDAERTDAQLPFDIGDHIRGRGRRERQDRGRAECAQPRERVEIRRSEIVSPLADAVGFIDDDEIDRITGRATVRRSRARQLLRRREHEFDGPPPDLARVRVECRAAGMALLTCTASKPSSGQFVELVAHQRDQRRDDHRHARHQHRGHLVAQRLAGAGGHDGERVLLGQHRVDHRLLPGTQLGHAEHVAHDLRDLGTASVAWSSPPPRLGATARVKAEPC